MKKIVFFVTLIATGLGLSSCGGENKQKDTPKENIEQISQKAETEKQDPNSILVKEIESSYTHDKQEVSFEGYFTPRSMTLIDAKGIVSLPLYYDKNENSGRILMTKVQWGRDKNSIYFPDEASIKDIELYDHSRQKLAATDKVKITGIVTYLAKGPIAKPIFDSRATDRMKEIQTKEYEAKVAAGDGNDYSYDFFVTNISKAE